MSLIKPILGAIERGGKVVAEVATELTDRTIFDFILRSVNTKNSELITDEFKAFLTLGKEMNIRLFIIKSSMLMVMFTQTQ